MRLILVALLVICSAGLHAACSTTQVWVSGHWSNGGCNSQWVQGRYVAQPIVVAQPQPVYVVTPAPVVQCPPAPPEWVPGAWAWSGNQWVWRDGYWSTPQTYQPQPVCQPQPVYVQPPVYQTVYVQQPVCQQPVYVERPVCAQPRVTIGVEFGLGVLFGGLCHRGHHRW